VITPNDAPHPGSFVQIWSYKAQRHGLILFLLMQSVLRQTYIAYSRCERP
jgi:hypothetical protein